MQINWFVNNVEIVSESEIFSEIILFFFEFALAVFFNFWESKVFAEILYRFDIVRKSNKFDHIKANFQRQDIIEWNLASIKLIFVAVVANEILWLHQISFHIIEHDVSVSKLLINELHIVVLTLFQNSFSDCFL